MDCNKIISKDYYKNLIRIGFENNNFFITSPKCGTGLIDSHCAIKNIELKTLSNNDLRNSKIIYIYRNIYIRNISGFLHLFINMSIINIKNPENNIKKSCLWDFLKNKMTDLMTSCKIFSENLALNNCIDENKLKESYSYFIDYLYKSAFINLHFYNEHFIPQNQYLIENNLLDLKIDDFVNLDTEVDKLKIYLNKEIINETKKFEENNQKNTSPTLKNILLNFIRNNTELRAKIDDIYQSDIIFFQERGICVNEI